MLGSTIGDPTVGHDIWVTRARIAEKTKRIKFCPSVLIPSYRPPTAQASTIATLETTLARLAGGSTTRPGPALWAEPLGRAGALPR
jgi:hypothetical protein